MSGTRTGGKKAAQTNKSKYGDGWYAEIGAMGGANGRGHKFAHGKIDPSTAGKLGGRPRKHVDDSMSYEVEDTTKKSFLSRVFR